MGYLDDKDKRTLKNLAVKIEKNYEHKIPYRLVDSELIFIKRMQLVYSTDDNLLLDDFMEAFEGSDEDQARFIMKSLLNKNV